MKNYIKMKNQESAIFNSFINVYDLENFELYSQTRDKSFRFVKFTGGNYAFLKEYLMNGRENLDIWPKKRLKRNYYYTIGRNLTFQEVELLDLRCCIASNPFLVTEEGRIPLFFDIEKARTYLQLDKQNCVFCYDEVENDSLTSIKNLYRYDQEQNSYFLYNQYHKRGFSLRELPDSKEWYVGNFQDGLITSQRDLRAVPTRENHSVRFDVDFPMMADKIRKAIYEINKLRDDINEPIVFNPSWEDYERFRVIGTAATNTNDLNNFATKLYNIIYEETKNDGKNRAQLPLKDHKFVTIVNELRNYFAHGRSEYEEQEGLSISDICENYSLGSSIPEDLSGLNKMQEGILQDFILFLGELYNYVKKNAKIKGRILCDSEGDMYCGSVLFPDEFQQYVNCYCQISVEHRTENKDARTSHKYKYYCNQPDFIDLSKKIEGIICIQDNKPLCQGIMLPENLINHEGMPIIISKIRSYKGTKTCLEYAFQEATAGVVTKDIDGNLYVEDVLISKDSNIKEGACVYVPNKNPTSNGKYPYMCNNPQIYEGIVQKSGFYYYCGPFLLPTNESYKEGDKLRLLRGCENTNLSTKDKYKYFAFKWSLVKN